MNRVLHVAADDRTGAFEVAAAMADRIHEPVPVAVWPDAPPAGGGSSVVDLASRHIAADEARARAAAVASEGRLAHKIDSTLRGNWPAELAARHAATGMPVLLIPALPSLGRVCVDGVVLEDGRPVHHGRAGRDPLGAIGSSRPADLLSQAGVAAVQLTDAATVASWLRNPDGVAVADAVDDPTIEAAVGLWDEVDGVLLAGTSAVIGAAIGRAWRTITVTRCDLRRSWSAAVCIRQRGVRLHARRSRARW